MAKRSEATPNRELTKQAYLNALAIELVKEDAHIGPTVKTLAMAARDFDEEWDRQDHPD